METNMNSVFEPEARVTRIDMPGRDIPVARANEHIVGYCLGLGALHVEVA